MMFGWLMKSIPNPAKLQREVALSADRAWIAAGEYSDEFKEFFIPVTFKICGNHDILRKQFKMEHGIEVSKAVGEEYFWASAGNTIDSAKVELWLVVKKTKAGNRILNKWAAGHGVMRIVNLGYRLLGYHFGDAGNTDKDKFFDV